MPTQVKKQELLLVEKPNGVPTHRPSPDRLGFVEWCELQYQKKLFVCHRLDKETSGAMVFATSQEAAQDLTELFSQRQVEKSYLFVSHKKSKFKNWVVTEDKAQGTLLQECPLQKEGVGYGSLTEIVRISDEGPLYLYKAKPLTGKTHQIRKHALHSQVPILGDDLYQGKSFPRLMLHCESLKFPWQNEECEAFSQASRLFTHLDHCHNAQLSGWLDAFERRQKLFAKKIKTSEALRLFHSETGDLRGEQVGSKVLLGWWQSEKPKKHETENIKKLMHVLEVPQWTFQWRPGAWQQESAELLLNSDRFEKQDWTFTENQVRYQASLERGQNFGLFLDQRDRRQWLKENARGQDVLNLFAFTCGFSLNAALGEARQVVSVDLFGRYLDWGKENFRLNGLDPDRDCFEWRKMDSVEYLKYAHKKNHQFDFVVCDPPSFSRAKKSKKVFRVERDYPEMLKLCLSVLRPKGTLLFSCNYEKWPFEKWEKQLLAFLDDLGDFELSSSPSQWDYEWQKKEANLKAFFIKKA